MTSCFRQNVKPLSAVGVTTAIEWERNPEAFRWRVSTKDCEKQCGFEEKSHFSAILLH